MCLVGNFEEKWIFVCCSVSCLDCAHTEIMPVSLPPRRGTKLKGMQLQLKLSMRKCSLIIHVCWWGAITVSPANLA